jgi:sec-independent protein translocase protein TatB
MLSIPHMIVVFVIVLVVFGPQKLPELARGLGKLMAEFRKASTDFKSAFENEMRDLERQAAEVERKKRELLAAVNAPAPQPATLATPSGVETQPGTAPLAPPEGDQSVTEGAGPVINPVAESVARSSEAGESEPVNGCGPAATEETSAATAADPLNDADDALREKPQRMASRDSLDAPHDYKQPA